MSEPCCRRAVALALLIATGSLAAQAQATRSLSLADARVAVRRASPDLVVARESANAARGRERQAAAFSNPSLAYSREQTSGGGQSNAQNIAMLEQPIELGAIRSARRDAARARREAAEARVASVEAQLDFDVARAYALALAADRRADLADEATAAFAEALRVSERRLAAGDVSGYAARRLKLEAARYAIIRAEAQLAQRSARLGLASLIAASADSVSVLRLVLVDSVIGSPVTATRDSLVPLALRSRAELRALSLEADAATSDAKLAARERLPVPVLTGGYKTEQIRSPGLSGSQAPRGFAAGISLPLLLWDRRAGAIEAADAEARGRMAELDAQRRRVVREVAEAYDAYRSAEEQVAALAPQLGAEARLALRAAQVAYTEGEIALVEWLDAVRAYREAESSFALLHAEMFVRRAALERAVGAPLTSTSFTGGSRAVPSPNKEQS